MYRAIMRTALVLAMGIGSAGTAAASGDTSKWPQTCTDAIGIVSSSISENARGQLREISRDQLEQLRDTLGKQIRTAFGMGLGNGALVHSCATDNGVASDPEAASMVIVEAVWAAVQ